MKSAAEANMSEILDTISAFEFWQQHRATIQQRLCEERAKLGSVIDILEGCPPADEELAELQLMADSVAAEIAALCSCVCQAELPVGIA